MCDNPLLPPLQTADWPVGRLIARFVRDDDGQDLVEYALLTAAIGVVGILAWRGISTAVGNGFTGWGSSIQSRSLTTPDPGAGGS